MTQELLCTYGFNLIINSVLSFVTMAALMQLLTIIFRVKQPRLKAILLCLPLFKLAIDPFLYDFQNWALMHQINPLQAETGTRNLFAQFCFSSELGTFATGVGLSEKHGFTFSIADIAALSVDPIFIKGSLIFLGIISMIFFVRWVSQLCKTIKMLATVAHESSPCYRPLFNPLLCRQLHASNVKVIMSPKISIPCAFGVVRKYICFPSHLIEELSQEEFEAIIAHELSHLQWYDGAIRKICSLISILFWWVPIKTLIKKMENIQERACDESVHKFNISKLDLASAIVKTIKKANHQCPQTMMLTCFVQESSMMRRLKPLLEQTHRISRSYTILNYAQTIVISLIVPPLFFGKLWIF